FRQLWRWRIVGSVHDNTADEEQPLLLVRVLDFWIAVGVEEGNGDAGRPGLQPDFRLERRRGRLVGLYRELRQVGATDSERSAHRFVTGLLAECLDFDQVVAFFEKAVRGDLPLGME